MKIKITMEGAHREHILSTLSLGIFFFFFGNSNKGVSSQVGSTNSAVIVYQFLYVQISNHPGPFTCINVVDTPINPSMTDNHSNLL